MQVFGLCWRCWGFRRWGGPLHLLRFISGVFLCGSMSFFLPYLVTTPVNLLIVEPYLQQHDSLSGCCCCSCCCCGEASALFHLRINAMTTHRPGCQDRLGQNQGDKASRYFCKCKGAVVGYQVFNTFPGWRHSLQLCCPRVAKTTMNPGLSRLRQ